MVQFKLTYDKLETSAVEDSLNNEAAGGHVLFLGSVRNHSKGKEVNCLEFESYEPMAMLELQKIAAEIQAQWPVMNIILHHRLGKVKVSEMAVIAGVSAAHRKEAFEACQYLMNRLKETVPIWKKEVYSDGYYWVSSTP